MKHSFDFRVYYEDTDAGGIVYHANYIKFCERGRTEFLRALELQNSDLNDQEGVLFVVRHLESDFHKPAELDDLLTVKTAIKTLKNTSFVMYQSIFRQDVMLFSMTVTIVCVDNAGKPVRLPRTVKDKFEAYTT